MEYSLAVSESNGASDLSHHPHALTQLRAQRQRCGTKASTACVFHAEIRQAFFAFADLVNGKNIWVIEARDRFRFTPKTHQRVMRVHLMRRDALHRYDPTRMLLARTIDNPHSPTPNLFQDFVMTETPVRVRHVGF